MITTKDIPHMRVYMPKVYLPVSSSDPLVGTVVFLNSKTMQGSIDTINNRRIYHNNKYKRYYIDWFYKGKLFTKAYRINLRKKRQNEYKLIKNKLEGAIVPAVEIEPLKGKNLYFDLRVYNEIFFKYTVGRHFKLRTKLYAEYLANIINDERLKAYTDKLMIIDTRDWTSDFNSIDDKKLSVTNPLFVFFYLMKWDLGSFKLLGDIDIIITEGTRTLKINPSLLDKDSYQKFKRELNKLTKGILPEEDNEEEIVKSEEIRETIHDDVKHKVLHLTGGEDVYHHDESEDDVEEKEEVESELEKNADEQASKISGSLDPEDEEDAKAVAADLAQSKEFIAQVYQYNKDKALNSSNASLARDRKLREEVSKIKLDNKTLQQLHDEALEASVADLKSRNVSTHVKSANKNSANVRYPDFDKKYVEEVMDADYINAFRSLEDKSMGLTIIKVSKKDSSDELNYKETLTVVMEDKNRVRHTVTVDVPKIIDNRYIFIGGNKKILYKQKFPYPITKTGPDTVQICTNYNKMFISRYGLRVTENIEKFNGLINTSDTVAKITRGNNRSINKKYITTFEYDEVSTRITELVTTDHIFIFNIPSLLEKYTQAYAVVEKGDFVPFGYDKKNKKLLLLDVNTQVVEGTDDSLIDFMVDKLGHKDTETFESIKGGTKFIHSRGTLMKKDIPLILLLAYCESLSGVLKIAGIKYRFSDKKPSDVAKNERVIRFEDGYFIYTADKFATELLLNGLTILPTRALAFTDFDIKDTYIDIFESLYGTRIIGNALDNFYECLLDPKTVEILKYLHYPTDFTRVVLFANELLSDNNHLDEDSMEQFRIRSFEMFTGMLYKGVADAYSSYRVTANNNNPTKVSLPRDYLMKKILTSQVVEDYSEINPIAEMEKSRTITPKGHSGLNLDRAYTLDKRTYSPTMKGIYGIETSPDAGVGVSRTLSLEPNIKNVYGMVDIKPDDELNDTNLFSPGELISPLGVTRDDPIRTAMAIKQSKHMIAVDSASPVLISNGTESTMAYHLSKDFVVAAEEDGKVVDLNDEVAVIKYKSGKVQAIDLRNRIAKNAGGGFYLSNKFTMHLKKGQTFKKNDIIASNPKFFSSNENTGTCFNIGSLQKIAVMPSDMTIEDSAEITTKISKDMASEIVKKVTVTLPASANIDYICKEGQNVETSEILIKFDSSTTDADVAKFLANVGSELKEDILSLSKNKIKSKVTGVIEKVDVYATVEVEELSPSLAKIVKDHYAKNKRFQKTVDSHLTNEEKTHMYRAGMLMSDTVGKTTPTAQNKVKGEIVENGVLIEFYIKYKDYMGIADKGAFFTALKFEVSNIIPEGYEPYTENRPDEEISSFLGTAAVIARKTPSILITMAGNKALIELKRSLYEMRYGKKWSAK